MVIGSTINLIIPCDSDFDISTVSTIIVYLQTDKKTITKQYGDGGVVTYDSDNAYLVVPMYQQDSMDLSQGEACLCKVQAQVNYNDLSVGKSKVGTFKLETSLSNTTVVSNAPNDDQQELLEITLY